MRREQPALAPEPAPIATEDAAPRTTHGLIEDESGLLRFASILADLRQENVDELAKGHIAGVDKNHLPAKVEGITIVEWARG